MRPMNSRSCNKLDAAAPKLAFKHSLAVSPLLFSSLLPTYHPATPPVHTQFHAAGHCRYSASLAVGTTKPQILCWHQQELESLEHSVVSLRRRQLKGMTSGVPSKVNWWGDGEILRPSLYQGLHHLAGLKMGGFLMAKMSTLGPSSSHLGPKRKNPIMISWRPVISPFSFFLFLCTFSKIYGVFINKEVCHTVALQFYIKMYLKAKEELWKLEYFIMQKYNLQKIL
jgi:hypothetical protein